MALRTGASIRRFESVEMGAVMLIVLACVAQSLLLFRFVPVLESLYAGAGERVSLPLRIYVAYCQWSLIVVPVALVAWMGFQFAGRPLPAAIRRRVLMVVAALAGPVTVAGLYFIAEGSLLQAMRLSTALNASMQVSDRDLSVAYLASGDPDQVIALLEPKIGRDDYLNNVPFGAPGMAFQLAEAYRAKGDLPAARRFYLRAQQAAVGFDEVMTPRMMARQARWQAQFGRDFDFWFPDASEMKILPDRIRAVSQQRLDQLSR
jgi:hypothetical protein